MNIKRAVFMTVLVVAIAALAVPLVGLRAAASGSGAPSSSAAAKARAASAASAGAQQAEQQKEVGGELQTNSAQAGKISPETLKALGITKAANPKEMTAKIGQMLRNKHKNSAGDVSIQSGQPLNLNARSALSDALIIAIGGRDNQFSEVALIADWDGREDCIADREQKVDDFSFIEANEPDQELTRTAISEHTVANGFNENVYYYGDSVGNLWRATDTNPGQPGAAAGTPPGLNPPGTSSQADIVLNVNIPQLVNTGASGGFSFGTGIVSGGTGYFGCMDDQVVVTGIAVNPVADLCDFGLAGTIGEIVYVSVTDTEGCAAAVLGAGNIVVRTSVFEFAFTDNTGAPGNGLEGVNPAGCRRIFVSTLANFAGVAVDDDGSLYVQVLDLIQFTGGAIFKLAETPHTTCGGTACISRVIPTVAGGGTAFNVNIIPTSINVWQGTTANPIPTISGIRATNYSGPSTLFGDIISIASGPCNVLYAAVSASFVAGAVSFDQLAQGLFPAPTQFGANGTPSMVISFADCSGAFDVCSGRVSGIAGVTNVGGTLPVADGFADVSTAAVTTRIPGVNNFRLFVEGGEAGKDLLPAAGGTAVVPGTPSSQPWLRIVGFQVDYSPAHSGLAVSQEGTVFVISGGEGAGVGKSPSPMVGEVLCFEDVCPADRRADFVDLRSPSSSTVPINNPNPGQGAGNTGDGVSDKFDHIFYQAPIDVNTATPAGLAGLSFGFLRYTNRRAPNGIQGGPTGAPVLDTASGLPLGQTGGATILGDDATTSAAIVFEGFDPGHQVAGGDDQNGPNRGDDSDTVVVIPGLSVAGNPNIPPITPWGSESTIGLPPGGLNGGFEFAFGGPNSAATPCVWNGLFLNSNGNLTFGTGDTSHNPSVPTFRSGRPRLAAAWSDLNPAARVQGNCGTFPVMALGFANVNAFKTRWINVPEFGAEACTALGVAGASNTFSITLYDDGTGADENTTETLSLVAVVGNNVQDGAAVFDRLEGPTDLRTTRVNFSNPVGTSTLVSCPPRPQGSGIFVFDYCRMDLLGTPERPVLAGYSIGFLNPLNNPPASATNPFPGLCEINLSVAAAAADAGAFGTFPATAGQIGIIGCSCCIGEGTEPTIFELFNEGRDAGTGAGGEVTFARPDFDLRFEGNDAALCTSSRQRDLNRGRVCFLGVPCDLLQPLCSPATPVFGTFVTTPTATGVVNALCAVPLNIVGCGFFPNEVTIICQGFAEDTGIPLQRPGKTVTTAATIECDTNADGTLEAVIVLASVNPVNCNLITATVPISGSFGSTSSSGFPAACCGGPANIRVVTTFTAGDNNIFGARALTTLCPLNLGTRAPIVFSVTPSNGDCSLPDQDLLISGACFAFQQSGPFGPGGSTTTITQQVTSVFAQDIANPATIIQARAFTVLNGNLIDAHFAFGSANAGKTFLIFVTGPGGTSRNLTTLPAGSPAGCPLGNEQGIQVTFKCNAPGTPTNPGTPLDIAVVQSCKLDRQPTGQFFLDVVGQKIKAGALVTVGGIEPKKIKVIEVEAGTTNPTKLRLVKKICNGLPGNIVITNPGAGASAPFLCTERCPAN